MRTVISGLVLALLAASNIYAQPPGGGGDRGSRGGFGGGFPGGAPGGGFPGGSRGGGGFPGAPGGMPGGDRGSRGGSPGGGFNPADMIRRFDRNGNNMIDPDESQGPAQFFLQRLAQSNPKIDLSKPVPIDLLTGEIDKMRGGAPGGEESSTSNEPELLVPDFSLKVVPEPIAGFGASSAMFNVKVTERDTKDAEGIVQRYDNITKDGVLSPDEIRRGRWRDDPLQFDRNRDGNLSVSELAVRSAKRRADEEGRQETSNNSSSRSRGGFAGGGGWARTDNNGDKSAKQEESRFGDAKSYRMASAAEALNGVKGLPDFFARSDADADGQVLMSEFSTAWNADTLNEFLKWDLNSDGIITSRECLAALEGGARVSGSPASNTASSSSSSGSSSSANAGDLEWAQRQISKYDKNGDKQLTAKEWEAMIVKPDGADTNKDGVLTAEEYAAFRAKK